MDLSSQEGINKARAALGDKIPKICDVDPRLIYNREVFDTVKRMREEIPGGMEPNQATAEKRRLINLWDHDDFDKSKYEALSRKEREKSEQSREEFIARKAEIDKAEKKLHERINKITKISVSE